MQPAEAPFEPEDGSEHEVEERAPRAARPFPFRGGQAQGRLRAVMTPLPKAGGYYARSWREYLNNRGEDELPVARPTLALASHAFLDEVVLTGFRVFRSVSDGQELQRIEREARTAATFCKSQGWVDHPETFFEDPPALDDLEIRSIASRRQPYLHVSFPSEFEPRKGTPGRQRWLSFTANRRAHAWMLRYDQPAPWLVCVHGTSMGRPISDLTLFRARYLHEQLGLNLIFPVLPLHGPRKLDLPKTATFPGEDVMHDVYGAAQSVWDIRRIISWIRTQDAQSPIGITGISLGGFVTSLVASTEDDLACAIAGVPVVNLVELIEAHSGGFPQDQVRRITRPAKVLGHMTSPLALEPKVPFEGRFIYAGLADRLVHPREQVERLWRHWGKPQIRWYPGGHTGFSRSKPVRQFLLEALVQSGLVERSRAKD